ncbi:MAG: MBL fold metallo-hydrolase [Candidatus Hodarchaeota archaeon]
MKVKFLGTAAAEAYPGLWCNCENCTRARTLGGRNLRCRSSALINDDLLVDYGPDTSAQVTRYQLDLTRVRDILFTHCHLDHLRMTDVYWRSHGYRRFGKLGLTCLWGNPWVLETIDDHIYSVLYREFLRRMPDFPPSREEVLEEKEDFLKIQTNVIKAHQEIKVGNYTVYTIDAHHNEPEESLNFIIDDGKTKFLYGTDTGPWNDSEWDYIESLGFKLDAVALDCTVGSGNPGGHHSYKSFLETKEGFDSRKLLSEDSLFLAHHFSHQSCMVYVDLVDYMKPFDVIVTFDGLEIERKESKWKISQ